MSLFSVNLLRVDKTIIDTLARIEAKLDAVLKLENLMKINVQNLLDAVSAETTVDQSILTLVTSLAAQDKSLAQQLAAAIANNDPVAMAAVQKAIDDSATTIQANVAQLQAAVTANTPAAPVPPIT